MDDMFALAGVLGVFDATIISKEGFRWTIEIGDHTRMLKLERKLQELTGRPIDLRLETEVDRNKRKKRTGRE